MTRTAKAFTSSLLGGGLTFAALTSPAAAQDARSWLNEASDCEVFRALDEVVPAACAQPGDTALEGVRTRGWGGKSRGIRARAIRLLDDPAAMTAAAQAKSPRRRPSRRSSRPTRRRPSRSMPASSSSSIPSA